MKKNKIIFGLLSVLLGFVVFMLIMDILSKPSNVEISLKPIDSLEYYYFGFVWVMGNVGWFVGSIFLIGFLALFYGLGIWIYKKYITNIG